MLATWLARPPWTLCARTGVGGCEKESSAHHTCHLLLGGWTVQRVNVRRWLIYDIYIRFGSPVSCTLVSWRLSAKVSLAVRTERPREFFLSVGVAQSESGSGTHSHLLRYFYLVCVCRADARASCAVPGKRWCVDCRVSCVGTFRRRESVVLYTLYAEHTNTNTGGQETMARMATRAVRMRPVGPPPGGYTTFRAGRAQAMLRRPLPPALPRPVRRW